MISIETLKKENVKHIEALHRVVLAIQRQVPSEPVNAAIFSMAEDALSTGSPILFVGIPELDKEDSYYTEFSPLENGKD